MSDLGGSRPESKGDSKGIGDIDGSEAVGRRGSTNRRRSSLGKGLGQSLADLSTERDATKPAFLKKVGNPILEAMALKYRNSFFSSSFVIMNPIQVSSEMEKIIVRFCASSIVDFISLEEQNQWIAVFQT